MKTTISVSLVGAILLISSLALSQQSNKAESLYQEALMQLEGKGNFSKALEVFGQIIKDYPGNRLVSARSQYQIGVCYEKLGKTEARKAYEQVVKNFADQPQVVAEARTRLAALSAASKTGRGPVARRLLSDADTDEINFYDMYPSRDGRRVAYVSMYDGSLHVRDLASGKVQQVASGMPAAWHYDPKWSPDGRRLAVTEHDLKRDATSIKLIDVATHEAVTVPGTGDKVWKEPAEWLRDGRYILFNRNRSPHLALIAVNGGAIIPVADSVAKEDRASVSPDGRFVAYAAGAKGNEHVFVQPVAGGARRQITEAPGGNGSPLWSPDGRAIAYQRTGGIWVVAMSNGESSGAPRLAFATTNSNLRGWTDAGLYFTMQNDADMKMIPYQVPMDPATGKPGTGDVQDLPGGHSGSAWFAWSPDMQRVAFTHWSSPEIIIYSTDRKALETFSLGLQGSPRSPSWSADGREVLVAYKPQQESSEDQGTPVEALNPATGRVRELFPKVPNAWGISFSGDGRRMAFWRNEKIGTARRMGTIVVASMDQKESLVVATARGADEILFSGMVWPRLSPRGDQVLFARQQWPATSGPFAPDASTLWVVASDGSGLRRLATASLLMSAVWDPRGRFIAYTGKVDTSQNAPSVLRVVEVATGIEHQIPLPRFIARDVRVTDWSSDGKFLGIVAGAVRGPAEYWVVQGLQEGVR